MTNARLADDIGATFIDRAVEFDECLHTWEVQTTPDALEEGIFNSVRRAMTEKGPTPADCDLIIYGITLATNALIESKGANIATFATEGIGDAAQKPVRTIFGEPFPRLTGRGSLGNMGHADLPYGRGLYLPT